MRLLFVILSLTTLPLFSADPAPQLRELKLDPLLKNIERSIELRAGNKTNSDNLLRDLGIDSIQNAEHSSTQIKDTWLSSFTLQREKRGIFKALVKPSKQPFIGTSNTDIAIQMSLDLSTITQLLETYYTATTDTLEERQIKMDQKFAGLPLRDYFQSSNLRIDFCVDFDDQKTLFLGKETIGYPHIGIRLTGANEQIESAIEYYMRTRNALFTKEDTPVGTNYTLPEYFSDAITGYLPIIAIDEINKSATIASSVGFLNQINSKEDQLSNGPAFQETWLGVPEDSSTKLYISKRALEGFHHFYLLSLREKWTDNPTFLKNKFAISAGVAQLNSSESGLALSLASEENSDTLTIKSPFASDFLVWLLGL